MAQLRSGGFWTRSQISIAGLCRPLSSIEHHQCPVCSASHLPGCFNQHLLLHCVSFTAVRSSSQLLDSISAAKTLLRSLDEPDCYLSLETDHNIIQLLLGGRIRDSTLWTSVPTVDEQVSPLSPQSLMIVSTVVGFLNKAFRVYKAALWRPILPLPDG